MAKNYDSTGQTVVITAPAAGTTAGKPLVVNTLVLVPLQTAKQGEQVTCRTCDAWRLPAAAGLKLGDKVSVLADGSLVEDGAANSTPFGKLISEVLGGSASALLIQ
jgi:predicted RecA/RadA family phage recombinase